MISFHFMRAEGSYAEKEEKTFDRIFLAISKGLWYNTYHRKELCRVGISVLQRLPKPLRRVRLPYPAPKKESAFVITTNALFLFAFLFKVGFVILQGVQCPAGQREEENQIENGHQTDT